MKKVLYRILFLCGIAVLLLYPGCKKEPPPEPEPAQPEVAVVPAEEPPAPEPVDELMEPAPVEKQPDPEPVQPPSVEQIAEKPIEPEPIVEEPEVEDKVPPAIVLIQPVGDSHYTSRIILEGEVADSVVMPGDGLGTVSSLEYSFSNPDVGGGSIEIGPEGRFRREVDLTGIRGDLQLVLKAADRTGQTDEIEVNLLDDRTGPHLMIISPPDRSLYKGEKSIVVTGTVTDSAESGECAEVASLKYTVDDDDNWTPVGYADNGAFSFPLPTAGLSGAVTVELKGEDKNGHVSRRLLTLLDSTEGPSIEITSPEGEGIYASAIRLKGKILPGDEKGEITSASFSIHGTDRGGVLELSREGSFSLEIDTENLRGMQVVLLKAEDSIGRVSESTFMMRDDGIGPFLTISAPAEESYYGPYVTVSGQVSNSEEDEGAASEVYSLGWEIEETGATGKERFRRNGEFQFEVPMLGVTGSQLLRVVGTDKNGNTSVKEILLLEEQKEEESLPPKLIVSSPGIDAFYKDRLVISGIVADSEGKTGEANEIEYLYYQLKNNDTTITEEIFFDLDGTFSYIVPVENLSGRQSLVVTAEKRDGTKTVKEMTLYDGNVEPELLIDRPAKGGAYGAFVEVSGRVAYPDPDVPEGMGIKRLFYEIFPEDYKGAESEIESGDIDTGSGEEFQFVFSGRKMEGTRIVRITAEAANGNRIEQELPLVKGESEIPSFSVLSGNGEAVVFWDPLPTAEAYRLRVEGKGKTEEIDNVDSPFRVPNLENGMLYRCSLEARFGEGVDPAFSSVVPAVPMGSDYLKPSVTGEFGQIRLIWKDIPELPGYVVLRSEREMGDYLPLSEAVEDNLFLDTTARFGRKYYYRIKPAIQGGVESDPVPGESLAAPDVKIDLAGTIPARNIYRIHVEGNYLYTANGEEGVRIIDISDSSRPKEVASIPVEEARDVVIRSDYAYIASGDKGLTIADITNPTMPTIVGSRKTSDAIGVAVTDTHAYIADGAFGVKIIDITNPKRPTRVGLINTKDAQRIVVKGDRLFLADGEDGIKIYTIQDDSALQEGVLNIGYAVDVDAADQYLYVADRDGGFLILDVSDPGRPAQIGKFSLPGVREVKVEGRYAYMLDEAAGLRVLDVFDPVRPVLFDVYPMEKAGAIAVHENKAYVAEPGQIRIINIFTQGKSYVVSSRTTGGLSYEVQLRGKFAYIADHQGGVKIIDVSNPAAVTDESPITTCLTDFAENLCFVGDIMYVADGFSGLKVFDLAEFDGQENNEGYQPAGSYTTDGNVRNVAISGRYGVLSKGKNGLEIVDVTNPADISFVSSFSGFEARDALLHGDVLYVAGGQDGLHIGRLEEEEFIEKASLPDVYTQKIAFSGSTMYVVTPTRVLFFDISDPLSPRRVGYYLSESCEDIVIYGDYAYLAEGFKGLTVLDISNPGFPVKVSVCDDLFAFGVDVERGREPAGYAFVADSFGLQIVEIHVPRWLK